jgi:hypothetical protein
LKQKASRYPGKPKLTPQFTRLLEDPASQTNCDTHGKINCLAPKVNPFFGNLVDNNIPETELSQHKKLTGCPLKK